MSSMSTTPRNDNGSTTRYAGPAADSPTRPVAVDPSLFRPEPAPAAASPYAMSYGPSYADEFTAARPAASPTSPTAVASEPTSPTAAYRTGIDHVRFWVGAGLAAAIAAMAALVGLLLVGGILHVSVPVGAGTYALMAAAIVIGASALYNLMLHVAPHPTTYYGALAAVGIALVVLLPFTVTMVLASQIAFAALNLVVGLLIAFLVPMAAVAARR